MIYLPKVLIIVLQYNNSAHTIKCLESLKDLNYPNYQVLIVDNGSSAEHQQTIRYFLSSHDSRFMFHVSRSNLGYSGGNNLGIKKAMAEKVDYVLILNNDVTVEGDLLKKMVAIAEEQKSIGLVGAAINEGGGRIIQAGKVSWLKPELKHLVRPSNHNSLFSIHNSKLYLPGACLLIKRTVIEKIGLLDERYFLYFEDADYSLRAKRAGFELKVASDTVVNHASGSTSKTLGSPVLLRYHYRNTHLFNAKHGPLWVKIALPFWSIFIMIKQLVKIVCWPRKRAIASAILAGVFDFYRRRFGKI